MKTLRVKGTGNVKTTPDLVIFKFEIEERDISYENCSLNINKKVKYLQGDIEKAGFSKKNLKNTYFNIETEYRYEDNTKKRVFDCYKATMKFKLEFDFTNEKLEELLRIIGKTESNAEFRINFSIKDYEKFRNELIENAVKDSIRKAKIMAKSAGVILGDIINIDYSWSEILIESDFSMTEMSCKTVSESYEIEPDDIEASDTVTVVWEIK